MVPVAFVRSEKETIKKYFVLNAEKHSVKNTKTISIRKVPKKYVQNDPSLLGFNMQILAGYTKQPQPKS
jgi:hypothetical protein